jgi:hypothetical protein
MENSTYVLKSLQHIPTGMSTLAHAFFHVEAGLADGSKELHVTWPVHAGRHMFNQMRNEKLNYMLSMMARAKIMRILRDLLPSEF